MIFNNDRNTQFSGELPCFRCTLKKVFLFFKDKDKNFN
ncbi:hypothetical protein M116_0143 [Bacteroides fragilis str. 3719 A10]|uniref:Uncharacterized protein n=1 Tax=Bacteroides fragilis str. 3783N1-6 TaxID=1339310 RepID=A0AB73AQN9_BACFG|nr:hypothetical protein M118_0115 [Bacteroides fragilis str. 3783N1-2]EXY53051.1 hypothetical protein M121_0093 [Bacteroides fragilis str. 3783N2-1]EXZ60266.1 hypothetical protein M116_0143 [Bacteroides fragilis str. 3719 A10]EYB11515.1 hypothetical protein M119_0168 [Bacteroides fragilis str. 3783N1-6]